MSTSMKRKKFFFLTQRLKNGQRNPFRLPNSYVLWKDPEVWVLRNSTVSESKSPSSLYRIKHFSNKLERIDQFYKLSTISTNNKELRRLCMRNLAIRDEKDYTSALLDAIDGVIFEKTLLIGQRLVLLVNSSLRNGNRKRWRSHTLDKLFKSGIWIW